MSETNRLVVASAPVPSPTQVAVSRDSLAPKESARPVMALAKPAVEAVALPRYVRESAGGMVLENFTARIEGENVSLVDADGSVYRGRITGSSQPATSRPSPARSTGGRNTAPVMRAAQAAPLAGAAAEPAEFYFQVSGTNRSLGQPVQLSGVFGQDGSASRNTPQGAPGASARDKADSALTQSALSSTNATFVRAMLRLGTNEPQFFRAARSP